MFGKTVSFRLILVLMSLYSFENTCILIICRIYWTLKCGIIRYLLLTNPLPLLFCVFAREVNYPG